MSPEKCLPVWARKKRREWADSSSASLESSVRDKGNFCPQCGQIRREGWAGSRLSFLLPHPHSEWLPSEHLPSNKFLLGNKAQGNISHLPVVIVGPLFFAKSQAQVPEFHLQESPPRWLPPPSSEEMKLAWGREREKRRRRGEREVLHPSSPSLPEIQLSKQPRLSTRQRFLLGEVKRAAALGKGGHQAPDLINEPALLLTLLHFLY